MARGVLFRQSSLAGPACSSSSSRGGFKNEEEDELESKLELLYLTHEGDVTEIDALLSKGIVDVNFADFDDRTALHVAACEGNADVVSLLIRKGADVNARDRWGSTPLADAQHYQNKDVCKLLIEQGAKSIERHEASMQVQDTLAVPEYEVNPAELDYSDITVTKKGYQVATWRGIQVFVKCFKDIYGEKEMGLNFMHEHKPEAIVHRDLKPKNILRDDLGHLKVADLGLSKVLKFAAQTISEDGPPPLKGSSCRYMAPEVFKHKAYGRKVDVFAFGLIVQEMIEGVAPMWGMENEKVPSAYADENKRPPFKASSRNYPGDLKKLIEECWDKDPEKRPTFMHIIDRLESIRAKQRKSFWKVASFWWTHY